MKKTIVYCGPYPEPTGGVSVHVKRLSNYAKNSYLVEVIDESPIRKEMLFNFRSLNFIKYFSIIKNADLVHINSSVVLFRFFHTVVSIFLRKKVVITVHSFRRVNRFYQLLNRLSFKLSHENIVVSEEISKLFECNHQVIPAFIKPQQEDFYLSDKFSSFVDDVKRSGKMLIVSNAYRLDFVDGKEIYGFSDLIQLFFDGEVSSRFSLILNVSSLDGCVDVFNDYSKYIKDNNLEGCVFLLNEKINFAGLLRRSDVYVRATVTDGDALSVRESLMFGSKTIASDCVLRPAGTILYVTSDIVSLKKSILYGESTGQSASYSYEDKILEIYKGLL